MEFFLGALIMLVAFVIFTSIPSANIDLRSTPINHSQSRTYELILPFLGNEIYFEEIKPTQSRLFMQQNTLRIFFLGKNAYWIKDNKLFKADTMNGEIQEETAVEVDTIGMNSVQLEETIFIVEKLREGFINDSWDSGNKKF